MKNFYLVLFSCLISINAFSQDKFEFVLIDSLDLSKDELYSKARSYMAYSFKDSKSVIQMDDKDNGRIIGKGNITLNTKTGISRYASVIDFTITFDVRDKKYRVILSDLYHNGFRTQSGYIGGDLKDEKPDCGVVFITKNAWSDIQEGSIILFNEFLLEIKNSMNSYKPIDDF